VVVIGTGVAGLSVALSSGARQITLLSKAPVPEGGSSNYAQGGVAAAVGKDDSPALHAADTVTVARGLGDTDVAARITAAGPSQISQLLSLGARLDRSPEGALAVGREAAHSRPRVVHAAGDATGVELVRTLGRAARRRPEVTICDTVTVVDVITVDGRCCGVLAIDPSGAFRLYVTPAVVLATGGSGQLWQHTTNPAEATADGLAMAARAGARLMDLEMVQFHPTALATGADPMPLLTEALRGEGATLLDGSGHRFMPDLHTDAELAPRDVVARAVDAARRRTSSAYLDATSLGPRLEQRFPTVARLCREHGLEPTREPIPIAPAAHYHMGGVVVDATGRTSVHGLWASGEVAATGLHGANRLASNSLLEALVLGSAVGQDLATAVLPVPDLGRTATAAERRLRATARGDHDPEAYRTLRQLMWDHVGVERTGSELLLALTAIDRMLRERERYPAELRNMLTVARLVARAALERQESRGAHLRTDFPDTDPRWRRHVVFAGVNLEPAPVPFITATG
jgi:L-aspartate oxidase